MTVVRMACYSAALLAALWAVTTEPLWAECLETQRVVTMACLKVARTAYQWAAATAGLSVDLMGATMAAYWVCMWAVHWALLTVAWKDDRLADSLDEY